MVIAPEFNGPVHRNMCVCVAQGLMREVVVVLPADKAVGEGRSLLQVRRRRTCTDKVRSHRAAAAATIHFSCVHYYITIIIIFPYNSTIVIQESVHRT